MKTPIASPVQQITAVFLLVIVAVLSLAGVSPQLHALFHGNAATTCETDCPDSSGDPAHPQGHHCAVHLFQLGVLGLTDIVLPTVTTAPISYPQARLESGPLTLCPLPGNRGPPILGFA